MLCCYFFKKCFELKNYASLFAIHAGKFSRSSFLFVIQILRNQAKTF